MVQTLLIRLKVVPDKKEMYVLFRKVRLKTHHQDQLRLDSALNLSADWFHREFQSIMILYDNNK